MNISSKTLKKELKDVFGYSHFRGNQEEIICNLLNSNNTFVIMPTGAGKSMCFQLPAIILEGTTVVISPLIALMKNQVDQLNSLGIKADFLNSTLSKAEVNRVIRETISQKIKLLYVAPESLTKEVNIEFLKKSNISFVAIDEAHCISEWGHDFRPEYRRIREIIDQIKYFSIIALTATATPKVRQDIQKNLRMEDANVFISSFHRKNLFYEVQPKIDSKKQLIRFVSQHKGKAGIVYCLSRKKVEQVAELLQINGFKALPYHAGMEAATRVKNQDAFLNEDTDVIVATIAFGMGIDRPDVRFVVHYDTPKSMEGYYQETGRAGRDGLNSFCLMLFSPKDLEKLDKFNRDKTVTERENARYLLREVGYYANSSVCRHKQLLHYFGEYVDQDFNFCDNTQRRREEFAGEHYLKIILKTVLQTQERFGIVHLAKVIVGDTEDDYVKSYNHNKLEVFGSGTKENQIFWESAIRQAMIHGLLVKNINNIRILSITDKGQKYLKSPYNIILSRDHDYSTLAVEEEDNIGSVPSASAFDETLFEMLKSLRKKIAKQRKLPPYVIFQDPSLEEMATTYPSTENDLAQVNGVGKGKVKKFGNPFIKLIAKYVDENDISTASDVVVKSVINKSKTKIYIIQQIDRKVDLEEIFESKGITLEELLNEIENICYSGTKLNLNYYINQILDREHQEEVYEYFMEADSDSIDAALEELGEDDYTKEEIRLMRIKFLSEHAM